MESRTHLKRALLVLSLLMAHILAACTTDLQFPLSTEQQQEAMGTRSGQYEQPTLMTKTVNTNACTDALTVAPHSGLQCSVEAYNGAGPSAQRTISFKCE